MLGYMLGTADANLTSAISSVTSYFTANIPAVIAAAVGIVVLFWLLRVLFRSLGIGKPKSAT